MAVPPHGIVTVYGWREKKGFAPSGARTSASSPLQSTPRLPTTFTTCFTHWTRPGASPLHHSSSIIRLSSSAPATKEPTACGNYARPSSSRFRRSLFKSKDVTCKSAWRCRRTGKESASMCSGPSTNFEMPGFKSPSSSCAEGAYRFTGLRNIVSAWAGLMLAASGIGTFKIAPNSSSHADRDLPHTSS